MTTFVRVLGAVLGMILGLQLAGPGAPASAAFGGGAAGSDLLLVWLLAWLVVGFLFLPYLTVVPAAWLVRKVQQLSTGGFVTAITGLLLGLLMGLLLGLPLSGLPDPYGLILPISMSLVLGLGMLGLTVAKRHDLLDALVPAGIVRAGAHDGQREMGCQERWSWTRVSSSTGPGDEPRSALERPSHELPAGRGRPDQGDAGGQRTGPGCRLPG